jgi:Domain of unknown function (DUF4815)
MTTPFSHPSGLPGAYDRTPVKSNWSGVIFRDDKYAQGGEWNEVQSILRNRATRLGDVVASNGNRIEGGDIIVNVATGTVTLTAGKIYVQGDIRPVTATILTGVPMVGAVQIGVRLTSTTMTEIEDPNMLGLHPGAISEGQPGAARQIEAISWGREGDGGVGAFYQVYLLMDGVAVDQTPPPTLSGVNAALALYDVGAHGHYVVSGCEVSPLGLFSGKQVFSIAAGEANINGFKRSRFHDLRHEEIETPELEEIEAEPRIFSGIGTTVFTPYHLPVSTVLSVTVEKEITDTIIHGGISGSSDAPTKSSLVSLVEVKQGATTFVAGTDYILTGDKIDWSPGGAEPATSSSYTVKYRYLDVVSLGADYSFTGNSITVNGGVTGGQTILRYTWKRPRIDSLCLNSDGLAVYVKGISAKENPQAPITPTQLLKLADISNDWINIPKVANAGVRSIPYIEEWRYWKAFFDLQEQVALLMGQVGLNALEPYPKLGQWADPFLDDSWRDQGVAQSAAIVDGTLQLAIDPTLYVIDNLTTQLDYTDQYVITQDLNTMCVKINPYQNFTPLPGVLSLTPSQDFWIEFQTQWLSDVTTQIVARSGVAPTTQKIQTIDKAQNKIPFLRQISVAFTLRGFGVGEILQSLTFDGIDVKPAGVITANAQGEISNSFTIPANVSAGTKQIKALGAGGATAENFFAGQGTLEVSTLQRLTAIATPAPTATGGGSNRSDGNRADPQAQTFTLLEGRHITGIDLKFCAKGNPLNRVLVELVKVRDGNPTTDVLAQAEVNMALVVLNAWTKVRLPLAIYRPANIEYAWVIKTNDAVHSIAMARIGDFDVTLQKPVSAQPYSFGINADSSNGSSWSFHQDRDITYRGSVALFSPLSKIVELGTLNLVDCSDLLVLAGVELPTEAARISFEIERVSGQIYKLAPGQWLALTEYVNEAVKFRAVLSGSAQVSPTLFAGVTVVAGKIRNSGTYVSRAFSMGTAIRLTNYYKALLPAGSTVNVECDTTNNVWNAMAVQTTTVLNGGWLSIKRTKQPFTAALGRLRVTLTGGPAARPKLADFNAVVV